MQVKTCKECGKVLPVDMKAIGLCPVCVDVVENLDVELDTYSTRDYYNNSEIFEGDY